MNARGFKLVFILAVTSTLATTAAKYVSLKVEQLYPMIATAGASAATVAYFKTFKPYLTGLLKIKDETIPVTPEFRELLGFNELSYGDDFIMTTKSKRKVAHALFKITDVPYSIDELDRDKKIQVVGQFSNMLKNLNFPCELIVKLLPVSASEYLGRVNKEMDDLRLKLSADQDASSRAKERLKRLEKDASRILAGEGVREVAFLCHILVEGKDNEESAILRQLELNASTLMSALKTGINVEAERLHGLKMLQAFREFFRATMTVKPAKLSTFFTWDLAIMGPFTKPKLPPLSKLLTGVYIGRTISGPNSSVFIDIQRYPSPHVVILGKSGYGKTTTLQTMISRMHDLWGTSAVSIDYTGQTAPWISSRGGTVMNMKEQGISLFYFDASLETLTDKTRELIDMFEKICDLSAQQAIALADYITKAYDSKGFNADDERTWASNEPPDLRDVIRFIDDDLKVSRRSANRRDTLLALKRKLLPLSTGPLGIFKKSEFSIDQLTQGLVCIDLSGLSSNMMKDAIAWTLLYRITLEMKRSGLSKTIRLVIVIDEAWKLCRHQDSLPVQIVKEGRKYGYCLIVSTQDATADLAESILANAGTIILHHTEYWKYLRFFKQSYGLTDQEIDQIRHAPQGHALVKIGDDPSVLC